jgi:hypothetical protein
MIPRLNYKTIFERVCKSGVVLLLAGTAFFLNNLALAVSTVPPVARPPTVPEVSSG